MAFLASEESETPIPLDPHGRVVVAVDPLDGSSNIDTNVSIGTIFSILPYDLEQHPDPAAALLQPGSAQIAAGFLVYGPATILVSSLGQGTQVFVFDHDTATFILAARRWRFRPRPRNTASTVERAPLGQGHAALYRRLPRRQGRPARQGLQHALGGLAGGGCLPHLHPRRRLSLSGRQPEGLCGRRLRLIYEANPIAFVTEQAGGAATDGTTRILDIQPKQIHQRIPLVFGSREEVAHIASYY